jgi:outer membrane protein TolC
VILRKTLSALAIVGAMITPVSARGADELGLGAEPGHTSLAITPAEAVRIARERAPDLRVARERQEAARAEVGIAGVLPNPSLTVATNTQTARVSWTGGILLPVFGQRGAAVDASRAELDTVRVESDLVWVDVRASVAHAYVQLWLAQERASARADVSVIAARLGDAVAGRVDVGASPEVDGMRTRAERMRSAADAAEAATLVDAAASQLAYFLATTTSLRARGEYDVPAEPPPFAELAARLHGSPSVRRENADARAADARAARESARIRPTPLVEVGMDIGDPTLPTTNYRGQIGFELPVLSLRGPYIEREHALARAARMRAASALARGESDLATAYYTFLGAGARVKTLRESVLTAAESAARATEESYTLGRAQLVTVLDAVRALLETRITLAEAAATRAAAWIEIERILGVP